ncbi:MAG: YjbQ family protein [Candidatus Marinimicrobia bacterium]|jgi:secondary thiamine-phosphate synthase enzyme|nr:YjbQ family protein [Candidatus Neomarinimicrobiota bacterium]MBT3634345.1 YjbQ family protein [Candidatus Neomarinimicrobiota bacterium]MBT3681746.1 YjbQ family protein [Candidatus Neomarinimicrobiota bacterium]MBT3759472.1 YjbQ family protein [Candidatus Neomarinimicrobiota bacterium]MBT3895960.1 YjbQ family protein [Candidatus Neomarinimicrobiota bacterium]
MDILHINTRSRIDMVDITTQVQTLIANKGWSDGILTLYVPHTTAGLTINENADPDVRRDMIMEMNKVIPLEDGYHHLEGNSAAHIKTSLFGSSETLIIEDGEIQLGTWQGIYFADFDGPRNRKVFLKFISS